MRWLEQHSWWVLLGAAGISPLFGLSDLLLGAPDTTRALTGLSSAQLAAESGAAYRVIELGVRAGGLHLIVIGILIGVVLIVGFRQGQRWAWWTMWLLPIYAASAAIVHLAAGTVPGQAPPAPVYSGTILAVLTAAVLVVSARRFFSGSPS